MGINAGNYSFLQVAACGRALSIFNRDGPFWLVVQQKTKEHEEWEKEGYEKGEWKEEEQRVSDKHDCDTGLRDRAQQIALPFERQAIRRHDVRQRA